jgi:dTDP-4-dehydrorhamnose 3,5-epimerase
MIMEVEATSLPGVQLLKPRHFHDSRGYFVETYSERTSQHIGMTGHFVQDNQSLSRQRGTIRALHFQVPPMSQAKLIRVLVGSIFDVAVDLRVGSPSYGHWVAKTLKAEGGQQLFVPRGFAHGFCTLEPNTLVAYKVDEYYSPEYEQGLLWNDPTLAIDWPVTAEAAVLSAKDQTHGLFADFVSPFRMIPSDV